MNDFFVTKAETLQKLSLLLKKARVLPQISFSVGDWIDKKNHILEKIKKKGWGKKKLIIRSSAVNEDSVNQSLAGRYTSIQNIVGIPKINEAIEKVISSFDQNPKNQVFIQPYLNFKNIMMSGVAFSKDPNTGSPYIVINYDDQTGSTDSVTSGKSNKLKTYYFYKYSSKKAPIRLVKIINLIFELESITKSDSLDIEFALDYQNHLYLLQARPLNSFIKMDVDIDQLSSVLVEVDNKIGDLSRKHPYLCGSKTVFGIMPDWNPAEIIGIRPKPLALSLYKELITDGIWAYQRHNYGYKNLRSFPLLVDFHGLPYIDVRVDFNSFIPSTVNQNLAEKLVNYYLKKLIKQPNLHDKIEFEIVYSCYTFDLDTKINLLKKDGFSNEECKSLIESLRTLTNQIINNKTGLWRTDLEKINQLERRRKTILGSELDIVSKIYWLLEDCKRYGTLPFAGLARAGFIAVQLLKSLVTEKILSQADYDNFMLSIDSISSQMNKDLNKLSKKNFLKKYGHLRPGTYDILSKRYDEEPNKYFDFKKFKRPPEQKSKFSLSLEQLKQIDRYLNKHGIDHNILGIFDFIKEAIYGREYAKFIFTYSLSDLLSLLQNLGASYSISDTDLAFLDINCIKKLYTSSFDKKNVMLQSIEEGKRNFSITSNIILPPLIKSAEDIWSFHIAPSHPNFITNQTAKGHVAFSNQDLKKIKKSILLIPSADPGYDWIFSHEIAGFITMYGGINSHMAIRAGELGIPAVIGTGETLFSNLSSSRFLEIDCINKQVKIVS
ncbi:phosphoenolpyruvate synthase [Candidatus Daviesbacteria bacterium]|nr:phosphoenolpyruvate synthase [Candidatus Daviesbacteria bacterium]